MDVVVDVGGREAIPVRAIPFVTGWSMSPDKVATVLAQTDVFTKMRAVGSYQLDQSGTPREALPKDWDQYVAGMDALTASLKAAQVDDAISYAEWQRLSIELLPAGVFVWKDEFEVAFNKAYSKERLTILHERKGDRELNFFPIAPHEGQTKVMEGFVSLKVHLVALGKSVGEPGDKPLCVEADDGICGAVSSVPSRPPELDAANLAFSAVSNNYGDSSKTFKQRLENWVEVHRPAFSGDAKKRIATVANPDRKPGRKKSF